MKQKITIKARRFNPIFGGPVFAMLLLCVLFSALVPAAVAAESIKRAQIEAGLIYKFISFIEWPENAGIKSDGAVAKPAGSEADPFVVGVVGNEKLADSLAPVAGRQVKNGRKLLIENLDHRDLLKGQDLGRFQILFLRAPNRERLVELLALVENLPVVTVSDMEGFVDLGGVVGFSERHSRMKFSINNRVAHACGIHISARLLRVAVRVIGVESGK